MIIFALLVGVFIGCSLSICIIAAKVAKSNDYGNDKGSFDDFSRSSLHLIVKRDRIRRSEAKILKDI